MNRLTTSTLTAVFLTMSLTCFAQEDSHFEVSPAKRLFQQSSWAHGYMHGYEAGFHEGNLDLHMARQIKDPHSVKQYKQAGHCYRNEFGSKKEFNKGYGSGFEVGYLDAASGKEFRAATQANLISTDLTTTDQAGPRAANFDSMLEGGYQLGRRAGLSDARSKAEFKPATVACPSNPKSNEFCDAYQMGFQWGYSDGYLNQRPDPSTQRASK